MYERDVTRRFWQYLANFKITIPFECAQRFRMGMRSVLLMSLIRMVSKLGIRDIEIIDKFPKWEAKLYTVDGKELKIGLCGGDYWIHVSVYDNGGDSAIEAKKLVDEALDEINNIVLAFCHDIVLKKGGENE